MVAEDHTTQLRKALAHLDDLAYLERLPLAQQVQACGGTTDLSAGQRLRRVILLGIDETATRTEEGAQANTRAYEVLYRYAVAKRSMQAIGERLGISERQAYRELRRAIRLLSDVLSMRHLGDHETASSAEPGTVRDEAARAMGQAEDVALDQLISEAIGPAEVLAKKRGIVIQSDVMPRAYRLQVNRVLLSQAILSLLSHAVTYAEPGSHIRVHLEVTSDETRLVTSYRGRLATAAVNAQSPLAAARELLELQGLRLREDESPDGTVSLQVQLWQAQSLKLLIVDDNPDLIGLLRRFLYGQPYQVHEANTVEQAVELLGHIMPRVVIIDVMMPDRSGWELVQSLQFYSKGMRPAIIVCSVINDPQLSSALGADAFLSKPVTRQSLLQVLHQVVPRV